MSKTGSELRREAKERMIKYRAEMTAKGYISTTLFLSQEHRAELKHLGDEHRMTRAEAAEHIFKVYLQSDHEDKDTTQTHNTNIAHQTDILAIIESMDARIKELENQVEITEEQIPDINNQSGVMPETEDNDGKVLELEIELDDSEDVDGQIDESETVIEQPVDTPGAVVIDGLVLEPDDSENKDTTQTDNTNIEQGAETLANPEYPETIEPVDSSHAGKNEDQTPELKSKRRSSAVLPNILNGIDPNNFTIEDRDRLVLKLHEQFPGRTQAKDRIKVLNDAGILLNGKPWTTKQYSDQLNLARKRAKK